jgi:hypothetical protein
LNEPESGDVDSHRCFGANWPGSASVVLQPMPANPPAGSWVRCHSPTRSGAP